MFTPTPPPDPSPPPPMLAVDPAKAVTLLSVRRRILSFALSRGLVAALVVGGPLGLLAGVFLPDGVVPFRATRFDFGDPGFGMSTRETMLGAWPIVTTLALTPFMITVFAFAYGVQLVMASIERSSRRTARMLKRSLERRFDSHL
jgi:hypothetical protein